MNAALFNAVDDYIDAKIEQAMTRNFRADRLVVEKRRELMLLLDRVVLLPSDEEEEDIAQSLPDDAGDHR